MEESIFRDLPVELFLEIVEKMDFFSTFNLIRSCKFLWKTYKKNLNFLLKKNIKISSHTIVGNPKEDKEFDLESLFNKDIKLDSYCNYMKFRNIEQYFENGHIITEKSSQAGFFNCLVLKFQKSGKLNNVKIFKNGKIMMTGFHKKKFLINYLELLLNFSWTFKTISLTSFNEIENFSHLQVTKIPCDYESTVHIKYGTNGVSRFLKNPIKLSINKLVPKNNIFYNKLSLTTKNPVCIHLYPTGKYILSFNSLIKNNDLVLLYVQFLNSQFLKWMTTYFNDFERISEETETFNT